MKIFNVALILFCFFQFIGEISADTKAWTYPDAPMEEKVKVETSEERNIRLKNLNIDLENMSKSYLILNSPLINKLENRYEPVKFMHKKHAVALDLNCSECHHLTPDRLGASETTRCSACHQNQLNSKYPDRMGLKVAYHRKCITCHRKMNKGPIDDCTGCHSKNVVDHNPLIKKNKKYSRKVITKECLRCHNDIAENFLKSIHGKKYKNKEDIDCMVCHDKTGVTQKKGIIIDHKQLSETIGHPSPNSCGTCHFKGKGDDLKIATLHLSLGAPDKNMDYHMGALGFNCQTCHKTRKHQDLGKKISCEDCHSKTPHGEGFFSTHLNMHKDHVACNVCHSAILNNNPPEKFWWDKSGDYLQNGKNPLGHIKDRKSKISAFKKVKSSGKSVYLNVGHHVLPGINAVSCAHCHEKTMGPTCAQCHSDRYPDRTCNRCHQDNWRTSYKKFVSENIKIKRYCDAARAGLTTPASVKAPVLNFKDLGYKGDPVIHGGRFRRLPIGVSKRK